MSLKTNEQNNPGCERDYQEPARPIRDTFDLLGRIDAHLVAAANLSGDWADQCERGVPKELAALILALDGALGAVHRATERCRREFEERS